MLQRQIVKALGKQIVIEYLIRMKYIITNFGIKIILIEPGAIGSNFWKNLKMAAKASGLDNKNNTSPYRQLANNVLETFKQIEQTTIIHLKLQR
jgi:short-subunit dehydrogenase